MIVGAPFLARSLREKWGFLLMPKEKPHFSQNRGEVVHPMLGFGVSVAVFMRMRMPVWVGHSCPT